ncbi:MAG: Na+/H+ antiporter NhaC family protein [Thermoplasmata archaeon]
MTDEKKDTEEVGFDFYGHNVLSLIPIAIFVIGVISLTLMEAFSLDSMVAIGVVGLIIGTFFSKNWGRYWDAIVDGFSDHSVGVVAAIFLSIGIYSQMMSTSNLGGGFVWLGNRIGLTGGLFVAFAFVACALFGAGTGTSIGTIFTMVPVLLPAGAILGGNQLFLIGAIVSGAAFGDNWAPVSDTTVLSSSSQKYRNGESADVGLVVRTRLKYALVAAAGTFILYMILGGGGEMMGAADVMKEYSYAKGLIMLVPMAVLIYLAASGRGIFQAIIGGIGTGFVISMLTGVLSIEDWFRVQEGTPTGIIPDGVTGMFTVILIYIVVMGSISVMKKSGFIDELLTTLKEKVVHTPRSAEGMTVILVSIMDLLAGGITTIAVALSGPLSNDIGKSMKLHPTRRANLVDGMAHVWCWMLPWSANVLIIIAAVEGAAANFDFLNVPDPINFMWIVFYSWLIFAVMLFATITGWGREFEGSEGDRVKDKSNKIPDDVDKIAKKEEAEEKSQD